MTTQQQNIGEVLQFFNEARRPVKSSDRVPGPFPYLGASGTVDYVEGFTHEGSYLCVSEDGANLLTRSLPIAWVQDGKFWANNHLQVLGGVSREHLTFFRYAIESTNIAAYVTGSAQPKLSKASLSSVKVPKFSRGEEVRIGKLLSAIDDKIVANQTSISKIDEILRALWQKELSLSNIDVPLSSLASFINGKAFTKGASGTGRVVVRIAEMNSGIGGKTVFSDFDADPDNEVNPGDLLFSWSGTLMTKRWPYDQAIVNQHIFKVVPNGQLDLWALRQAIDAQLEYFQMIAAGKATTMGHIKRGDLDQEVEVPAQMSEETNQLGNSLWGLATSLEIQNLQLARTRDELLPLLMSGRITVGEAEDVAGTAASES
ncbi:restriction endonuclease subunit S [Corynebacterium marquesiae]|uniref:restriction endonuclease subunit S n=1 Tax=Corynebacterium marquesiae TaxID=2913503 RepID=UPI0018E19D79|nr:restriction endonuclease subunit S [Corynebacterium tuberculostearicum]